MAKTAGQRAIRSKLKANAINNTIGSEPSARWPNGEKSVPLTDLYSLDLPAAFAFAHRAFAAAAIRARAAALMRRRGLESIVA